MEGMCSRLEIKDSDGNVLMRDRRWKEYSEELMNEEN